jgi:internalin A
MKYAITLVVIGAIVSWAADEAVAFRDPGLASVAGQYVPGGQPGQPLTEQKAATVILVRGGDTLIRDLSGLEKFRNLRFLHIAKSEIAGLAPLAGLTSLESITIQGGTIQDLTPLAGLKKLTSLSLPNHRIEDLRPLAGLTALESIHLGGNRIADLSPISGLPNLQRLRLEGNRVTDLAPLGGLAKLVLLDLKRNRVRDLTALKSLDKWQHLYLDGNQVAELRPLVEMLRSGAGNPPGPGLFRSLSLRGNPLTEAARTSDAAELRKIVTIVDIDP